MVKFPSFFLITLIFFSCNSDKSNSAPNSFQIISFSRFQGCGEFLDQKERIMFNITEPNDSDGNIIEYEINYGGQTSNLPSIGTTNLRGDLAAQSINGEIHYNLFEADLLFSEFPDLTNEENVELIITAKDGNGGESIASETYNVNSTNLDLGTISLPFFETYEFDEESELIDKKIEISFNIINETNFSINVVEIENSSSPKVSIKNNSTGSYLNVNDTSTTPNSELLEGVFPIGSYTIIIKGWLFPSGMSAVCIPLNKLGKGNVTIDFEEN